MDVKDVWAALRASWWLVIMGLLAGGVLGATATVLAERQFTAHTQLFVSTTGGTSTAEAFQGSQFSQQRVASYARLLSGEELAGRVIADLGLDVSPKELADQISATAFTETVLLDVTVTDSSPQGAQRIAASLGEQFTELVSELETPDGEADSPVKVTVVDRPEVPEQPSSPRPERNVGLGVALGLLVGSGAALARWALDRTVKLPAEASEASGVPVIGTVVQDEVLAKTHVVGRQARTRAAEDYRQLRVNLQFLGVDHAPRVIMLSSAMPGEGKTTSAINLALALAEAGRSVTLVDADLRRPRVTAYLGLIGGVGLTNVLAGTADVVDVLQPYGDSGVLVVGAGPTPPNPSELLASEHMRGLIDALREKTEYVLIDAPPLLPVADATGLAVLADGVLLTVRYGQSRKDQLQQASAALGRVGARTLGLILNVVPLKAVGAAAYGYGYSYDDSPKHAR